MKRSTRVIALLSIFFTVLVFHGCEKFDLDQPVECSLGTSYRINSGLSFSIDSLRDYRCPLDLECFWGGDVDLYFKFDHHLKNKTALINLNSRDNNPFTIGGYTFKVQAVNPQYRSDEVRKKEDYRVQMVVTKN
jgi:hypothetical protein